MWVTDDKNITWKIKREIFEDAKNSADLHVWNKEHGWSWKYKHELRE